MTNAEKAEIVALVACVLEGLVTRKSAISVKNRASGCLGHVGDVREAVLEWLQAQGPKSVPVAHQRVSGPDDLLESVRAHLSDKSRRQNVIEQEMLLDAGVLDGLLTEANGFTVNAQGWVRVAEAVPT